MLAQPQREAAAFWLPFATYQRCLVSSTNLNYLWKNIMTQLAGCFLLTSTCWLGQFAHTTINPALNEAPTGNITMRV